MKKKLLKIGLPILIVIVIAFIYFQKEKSYPVSEIVLLEKQVQLTVSANGEIKAKEEADLSFSTLGKLSFLNVKKGDLVKKGAYLASLDNYSEAKYTQSLKDARDIALRDKDLFVENYETNPNAVGGRDEYEISLRRYDEYISRAQALYDSQLGTLGKTNLYAPINGKIIDIYYQVGETVLVGSPVIKIADTENLIFEIQLDQEDYGYLKENQEVNINLDSFDNEEFHAQVLELPSYVESGNNFVLSIDLIGENKNKALLGMTGDAYIVLQKTPTEVNAISFDELYYDEEDEPYLFVAENNIVKKYHIETGLEGDIYTEIKNEISLPIIKLVEIPNSKIELAEGMKVKIR